MLWIVPAAVAAFTLMEMGALSVRVAVLLFISRALIVLVVVLALWIVFWWHRCGRRKRGATPLLPRGE